MKKIYETIYDLVSDILEFLAIFFVFGGAITLYTLIASTASGKPFPAWFEVAWVFYSVSVIIAAVAALAIFGVWCYRKFFCRLRYRNIKNRRRLGMVRMDHCTGRFYYEGRRGH
jgi:hypothetical protein